MNKSDLPFEIERACRCSFVVRFTDGTQAFISNSNLLAFLNDPRTEYTFVLHRDARNGIETKWVAIRKCGIDLGFKRPMFNIDGTRK